MDLEFGEVEDARVGLIGFHDARRCKSGLRSMALFSMRATIIGRSRARSAVAAAAYRAGAELTDERRGERYSYTRKRGISHVEILAPKGAPSWVYDRSTLWNAAERAERYCNAQVAREIRIALPVELTHEAQLKLVRSFVTDEFVARGMVADVAVHREKDHNPHVHVMLTMRELGPDGFGAKGTRWNSWALHRQWRQAWEHYANRALALEGRPERIDHRSYAARGIELTPEPKLGASRYDNAGNRREVARAKLEEWRRVAHENGALIRRSPIEALKVLTSNQSTFTRKQLYQFLNGKTLDTEQFTACLNAIVGHPDLVGLGVDDRGEERFTARHVLLREEALLEVAQELAARRGRHVVRADDCVRVAAARTLGDDQRRALHYATVATGDIAFIEGYAGTGKSHLLGAAREAWEAQGYTVVGGALAGKATEGLTQSSGIASRTLASWELAWTRGHDLLTREHVLVLDEAGMVGTAQMARVLIEARRAGAKVVLVGDSRQLAAIEAGAPMRVLRDQLGAAVLSEIRRQAVEWQKVAALDFAEGRAAEGLHAYADRGLVHHHVTQADARERVVEAWQRDRTLFPGESALILSYRRADVRALNEAARQARRKGGELGEDRMFAVSDGRGLALLRSFAAGDRVYFLKNDRRLGVMNGTLGTIEKIAGQRLAVHLDSGHQTAFDIREYDALDHGYAATVHKGQGVTVDRAYVLASKAFDEPATYVAMSRHRQAVELHWSSEEFRPAWIADTVTGLEEHGTVSLHTHARVAEAAAVRAWRERAAVGAIPPLLTAATREEARRLNLVAREVARLDGRLGPEMWTRTDGGARSFAVGDRVQATKPIHDSTLRAGDLGTVIGHDAGNLVLQLDRGGRSEVDVGSHGGIDYGYAATFEQCREVSSRVTIAVASEVLTERQREVLERAHRGDLHVHGVAAPDPSVDVLFRSMTRPAIKEQAVESKRSFEEEIAIRTAPLREHYRSLNAPEQEKFLGKLKKVAQTPSISNHEALCSLAEVRDAAAAVEHAEEALRIVREYRENVQRHGTMRERLEALWRGPSAADFQEKEQGLRLARDELERLHRDADLERRAELAAREHNRKCGETSILWHELTEERERPERQRRIAAKVAELAVQADGPAVRLACEGDFDQPLQLAELRRLGNDRVVICANQRGDLVVFDARSFKSDLAAVPRGEHIEVSPQFEVSVGHSVEAAGVEV